MSGNLVACNVLCIIHYIHYSWLYLGASYFPFTARYNKFPRRLASTKPIGHREEIFRKAARPVIWAYGLVIQYNYYLDSFMNLKHYRVANRGRVLWGFYLFKFAENK